MFRVGVIAIQHESNTWLDMPTTWESFEQDVVAWGPAIVDRFGGAPHEVGGFFEGLQGIGGIEAVPLFAARAIPGGTITADTDQRLIEELHRTLPPAGELDALLVAPHGAAVSQLHADFDGHWLNELRRHVGTRVPIVGTLDLHANVSPAMVRATDALLGYRTNPHLDQRERGVEAARLVARALRGEVALCQVAACVPIVPNIERQNTDRPPCSLLYAEARRAAEELGMLSYSVLLGFPYADVPEIGGVVVMVSDGARGRARQAAQSVADWWCEHREAFRGNLTGIEEAVEAVGRGPRPLGLLDMGDNVGGGSPGDGTTILRELQRRCDLRSLACLWDPEAVEQATRVGVGGSRSRFRIGGKTDRLHGPTIECEAEVVGLYDGRFTEPAVRHGGKTEYDMGPTAVVETDFESTLVLHSRRTPPFSLRQITAWGIDPAAYDVIVIKGVQAPIVAYESVCPRFLRVDTPGVTTANMMSLPYRHRRRPLFPFENELQEVTLHHGNPP